MIQSEALAIGILKTADVRSFFGSSGERLASKTGRSNRKMRKVWDRIKTAGSAQAVARGLLDRAQARVDWMAKNPGAVAAAGVGGAGVALGLRYLDRYQDRSLRPAPLDDETTR